MWAITHFSIPKIASVWNKRMEQREHPRIQIPLLVELSHPAIGLLNTIARDISEGGLFVHLPNPQIKVGGKIKLRLMTILPTDTQVTPTVEMQVIWVSDEGLGLAFTNRTAEHLWKSVRRLRDELEIGRDYFQIHQSLAVANPSKGLLLVQQDGKWLFPGHYLTVGENATNAILEFAESELGLSLSGRLLAYATDSSPEIAITEAATYSVIFSIEVDKPKVKLTNDSEYRDWRWLAKHRDLNEITFASDQQRVEAKQILKEMSEPNT
jgi:hypothetical protein